MLEMSASAKPATTSSLFSFSMVMKPVLEEVDDVEEVPVEALAPKPELVELDEPVLLEELALLEPVTDSPTLPFTAVTVPSTGAVSVVSDRSDSS